MAKHKKKQFGVLKVLISAVVLAIVLAAAFIAIKCDGDLSWDNIERTVKNLSARVRSAETFEFGSSDGAVFADVGGGLLKLTGTRATLYSAAGSELYSEKLRFSRPMTHACSGRAVAYGAGDREAFVFDGTGLAYSVECEDAIISASVSAEGKLAVCTLESGWNGSVSVYSAKGAAQYKWYCSSGYPSIAAVSRDGGKLAVLTFGSEGAEVVLLRTDREQELARYRLGEKLALDLRFMVNGNVAVLTEDSLLSLTQTGEEAGNFSFDGRTLSGYDMGSDELTLLRLEDFPGGSSQIVTVGPACQELGRTDAKGEVLSLSASGQKAAVLYRGEAVIYRKDLTPEVSLLKDGAEKILMRKDGSALILDAFIAEKLEP
ncbi:MAG: hypothetical protein IK136_00560 [Oscillospiraceae bacterium]|nr:hypothetical protein [Oscillospiraceae bacterium]